MVTLRENSSKLFCREAEKYLLSENYSALDYCIVRRERRIKGSRRKIDNPTYTYDPKYPVHNYKLSYRWETVKAFADELRKEVTNG